MTNISICTIIILKGVINMKYIICIGGMIELSIIFGLLLFIFNFRNN
nr:MAG TPA: hypothetical protein [Caudoviricetes sp.]